MITKVVYGTRRTNIIRADPDAAPLKWRSNPVDELSTHKRAGSESVWYGSFNLVRQTSLNSTGSAAVCVTGVATDSNAAHLSCAEPDA